MSGFSSIGRFASKLCRDSSAVSLIEFALVLPILLTFGLFGADIARMTIVNLRVSQIALSLADNASRLGQTDNSGITPTITEANVDAIIAGALRDGESINLESDGRLILSSLEYDDITGKQYIHWQRCRGALEFSSRYGNDTSNNGLNGSPLNGMGSGSHKITAMSGQAVMFVEIQYNYKPLFENPFGTGNRTLRKEAAFLTRDDRNLAPGLTGGASESSCN
jgi:hypothetical protein